MSNKEFYVLTDEYMELITQIKELYDSKKNKKAEFKAVYDKFQEDLKNIDTQAKELESKMDSLKKNSD